MSIDLHAHTTASDGELSPSALVERALALGIETLAITDHDTVSGIEEAARASRSRPIRIVPGIELSTRLDDKEVHLLGHFVDPTSAELSRLSGRLKSSRADRMRGMLAKLDDLGIAIPFEEVVACSGGETLARPHLALALMKRGHVVSVEEAFHRYLEQGRPAYVERFRLGPGDALALVHRAGGTATLAHPAVSQLTRQEIARLRTLGLDGLEADHTDHTESERAALRRLAEALDLVPTGGTDFHGERVTPDRKLGAVTTDPAAFARLEARSRRWREEAHLEPA